MTHRVESFVKVRLVINYRQEDLHDDPVFLITNRLHWQALGITRIRRPSRKDWPVEVYHEGGKAEGLDQYQLRDFEAIGRHIALVAILPGKDTAYCVRPNTSRSFARNFNANSS